MADSVSKPHEQAYGMLSLQHGQDCFSFLEPAFQATTALLCIQPSRMLGPPCCRKSFTQCSFYVLMTLSSTPGLQCLTPS